MKKLSLRNVKNTLSRKEMKAVSGGYGYGYDLCVFVYGGSCHYVGAGGVYGPGWYP